MAAQHIVALVGSYREGGTTDQAVDALLEGAREQGATTEVIPLRSSRVMFCDNCRRCTQASGSKRGECHLDDDVFAIFDRMDAADALVLAAPVNNLDVTAITRAVLERTVAYFHWPWGEAAPLPRRAVATRPAVLLTSSAMPRWMGMFAVRSMKTLNSMARAMGARSIGRMYVGLAAGEKKKQLSESDIARARALGQRLVGDT